MSEGDSYTYDNAALALHLAGVELLPSAFDRYADGTRYQIPAQPSPGTLRQVRALFLDLTGCLDAPVGEW